MARSGLPIGTLVIGLVARLVLAPFTADTYDISTWFHATLSGFYGLHLYDRPGFSYPPVWGYVLNIVGSLAHVLGFNSGFFGGENAALLRASSTTGDFSNIVTSPAFNLVFKDILFGFDLATGILIYRFLLLVTGDLRRAKFAFTAWFLNPFVIYQSAVHGASDIIVGFSVLATVVLVLYGRAFWGGVAWMIGILTKLSPAVLILDLVIALAVGTTPRVRSPRLAIKQLATFAYGVTLAGLGLLAPIALSGSLLGMFHNVFARGQENVVIGGLSLAGVRYLKPWAWLLPWAFTHSPEVLRLTTVLQATAILAWAVWTITMVRRSPVFGLLVGTVGTLSTFALLSPVSNPQYVLWWLPALTALVVLSRRGYVQLALLTVAPLVFSLAILGPAAILAPLATYTHLVSVQFVSDQVTQWYLAPGRLWGASLPDDFFAPAVLTTIAALTSLFVIWLRLAFANEEPRWQITKLE